MTAAPERDLVWRVANNLRLLAGTMLAAIHIRRKSMEPFGEKARDETARRVLLLTWQMRQLRADNLPRVLEDREKTVYRVRVLAEALSGWSSWLSRTGPMDPDEERWVTGLQGETYDLAVHLDHAWEAMSGARREPLSDEARLVYAQLCSLPETDAMAEKEIVRFLGAQGFLVGENRVRKRIRKELEPYGIEHKAGVGYFIPVHKRPPG